MLRSAVPVLPARDIAEAVAFYAKLGFKAGYVDDDYAVLSRDGAEMHFFKNADSAYAAKTTTRLNASAIDAFHALCGKAGVIHPNGALADKPWGTREFSILDPSGVCITIQVDRP
jgi:catechol 2,3-dioxygenase-like lactoylglutathione lyase family enzyme